MKAKNARVVGPIATGLAFLLGIIFLAVAETAPVPKDAQAQQQLLETHEGIMYFYNAESLAKQLAPDPSLRWSHQFMAPRSGCWPLGNDVWYASGLIQGPAAVLPAPPSWEVCFLAQSGKPLFVRVGNLGSGDAKAALQAAGRAVPPSSGAARAK